MWAGLHGLLIFPNIPQPRTFVSRIRHLVLPRPIFFLFSLFFFGGRYCDLGRISPVMMLDLVLYTARASGPQSKTSSVWWKLIVGPFPTLNNDILSPLKLDIRCTFAAKVRAS